MRSTKFGSSRVSKWQLQNSLQSRISRYDLSRKAALGQTDRGLLEKGIEFRLGGSHAQVISLIALMDSLCSESKSEESANWAASDLGFPKMGRITATSAPTPEPNYRQTQLCQRRADVTKNRNYPVENSVGDLSG